jgi:hypothetical protein
MSTNSGRFTYWFWHFGQSFDARYWKCFRSTLYSIVMLKEEVVRSTSCNPLIGFGILPLLVMLGTGSVLFII